jgi:hypothetical protein
LVRGNGHDGQGPDTSDHFAQDLNRTAHEHHGSSESHGDPASYD